MNVVIRVSDETKAKMIDYYKDKRRDKEIPYVVFQAVEEDTVITMYTSGKVMFQGVSADVDASMWKEIDGQTENKEEKQQENKLKYGNSYKNKENYILVDEEGKLIRPDRVTRLFKELVEDKKLKKLTMHRA